MPDATSNELTIITINFFMVLLSFIVAEIFDRCTFEAA